MIEKIIVEQEELVGNKRAITKRVESTDQTLIESLHTSIGKLPPASNGLHIDFTSNVKIIRIIFEPARKKIPSLIPPYPGNTISFYSGLLASPDGAFYENEGDLILDVAESLLGIKHENTATSTESNTQSLPVPLITDVQIKVALRAKNYSAAVKINGADIIGTTMSEPDPIPTGGSAVLINKDHSVFSRPDATTQDKEFLSMFAVITSGENSLTASYTKTPGATDAEATITIAVLSSPDDTEGSVIYEALIKSDSEGTLAFPFTLPYIEKPVKITR